MAAMDLQQFVAQTLVQIANGVKNAQEHVKSAGGIVNPLRASDQDPIMSPNTSFIEFDVALTVTEGSDSKGGIGIFVADIGLGAQGRSRSATESVSRIKFKVPMFLPTDKK